MICDIYFPLYCLLHCFIWKSQAWRWELVMPCTHKHISWVSINSVKWSNTHRSSCLCPIHSPPWLIWRTPPAVPLGPQTPRTILTKTRMKTLRWMTGNLVNLNHSTLTASVSGTVITQSVTHVEQTDVEQWVRFCVLTLLNTLSSLTRHWLASGYIT